jgi:hypothetical protein
MDLNSLRVQELIFKNRQFTIRDAPAALQMTIKTAGSTSGNKYDAENKFEATKYNKPAQLEKKAPWLTVIVIVLKDNNISVENMSHIYNCKKPILDAFAKLQKATICFVWVVFSSVRPPGKTLLAPDGCP